MARRKTRWAVVEWMVGTSTPETPMNESRVLEYFPTERAARDRVLRLTVEKGGGGTYYTAEMIK